MSSEITPLLHNSSFALPDVTCFFETVAPFFSPLLHPPLCCSVFPPARRCDADPLYVTGGWGGRRILFSLFLLYLFPDITSFRKSMFLQQHLSEDLLRLAPQTSSNIHMPPSSPLYVLTPPPPPFSVFPPHTSSFSVTSSASAAPRHCASAPRVHMLACSLKLGEHMCATYGPRSTCR